MCSSVQMLAYCKKKLSRSAMLDLDAMIEAAKRKVQAMSAWRVEGTLREFPKFPPVNLWFDYPTHRVDLSGALGDIQPETDKPLWQKATERRKEQAQKTKEKKLNSFEIEFSNIEIEGREVPAQELADKLETPSRTLLAWLGDSSKQKADLKKRYEKYQGEDGKMYVRRREEGGAPDQKI